MPYFDFRCPNGHVHDDLVKQATTESPCPVCEEVATKVILSAPNIAWNEMGSQRNAGPEFKARFDRVHREQKAKEAKCKKEHGDYGPRPGAD